LLGGAVSPDKGRVLTVRTDRRRGNADLLPAVAALEVWDPTTHKRVGRWLSPDFTYVAFSPDSRSIVATFVGGNAIILDATTGDFVGTLGKRDYVGHILCAAFSPDGKLLATGGEDKTARIWWLKTGKLFSKELRHGGEVLCAAFAPGGKILATSSLDGTVHLWDISRGSLAGIFECKPGYASEIAFSPDGSFLHVKSSQKITTLHFDSQQVVSPWVESAESGGTLQGLRSKADERPVTDLVKLAQLYSGRRLDEKGGAVPLDGDELKAIWRELRARYPQEFSASPYAVAEWRVRQLNTFGIERPAALAFHRRWLAAELKEAGWDPGGGDADALGAEHYFERLSALVLHGRHAAAAAAADELAGRRPHDANSLYGGACVHALAAEAVKGDAALARRYVDRAVARLRKTLAAGGVDANHVKKDPDLDVLRHRNDFQQVLKELDSKR
jgi:hypothetical protein